MKVSVIVQVFNSSETSGHDLQLKMKSMLISCIRKNAIPSQVKDTAMAIPKTIPLVGTQPVRRVQIVVMESATAQEKLAMLVIALMTLVIPAIYDTCRDIFGGARAAVHQYWAPLIGIEEHNSAVAKAQGKKQSAGINQPLRTKLAGNCNGLRCAVIFAASLPSVKYFESW